MAISQTERKQVTDGIAAARRFMRPRAEKHRDCCRRYIDPSGDGAMRHDGGVRDMPEGEVNWMAMNIRQKLAVLAYNHPDHICTCSSPDNAQIVRAYLKDAWRAGGWRRIVMQSALDMFISGLGFMGYLWDTTGFVAEYVAPGDILADPNTVDATWNRLRAGGWTIRMPVEDAKARYGKEVAGSATVGEDINDGISTINWDAPYVSVDLWWTEDSEYEVVGETILKRPNLYGRVPLLVLQGNLDPRSHFAVGDYDEALGASELLRKLMNILGFVGRFGNGYPWVRADMLDGDVREAVLEGSHDGVIPITAGTGSDVFGYTPVTPLNPALTEAIRMVSAGVDADQAVDQYSRGAVTRPSSFATEAALQVSAGGARAAQVRANFEEFCEGLSRACVDVSRKFLLDPRKGEPTDAERMIWEALLDCDDVRIVEESTTWRDPGQDLAQAVQVFDLALRAWPTFMQMAQMGLASAVPNLQTMAEDVLRAARRRQTDSYFVPVDPAAMVPQATPGVGPSGDVASDGGVVEEQGVNLPPGTGGLVDQQKLEGVLYG